LMKLSKTQSSIKFFTTCISFMVKMSKHYFFVKSFFIAKWKCNSTYINLLIVNLSVSAFFAVGQLYISYLIIFYFDIEQLRKKMEKEASQSFI
jgi:hypothetical protein